MLSVASTEEYISRIFAVPRPGLDDIVAFYEHRLGLVCKEPKLMLMPLDDHLAHRGDGIFDNIKYINGRIYQLEEHLARIKRGCASLFMEPPCDWDAVRSIMFEVARIAGVKDGILRILIGRGPGGFGVDPFECPESSLYVVAYRFKQKPESWFTNGISSFRTSILAKSGFLSQVKNTNYIPNVLMTREARIEGFDIPLCFDEDGFLAESAVANICLVDKNGVLSAPEFSSALPGTTILRAMQLIGDQLPTTIRKVREEEIFEAKELLMLGTSPDCAPIVSYEGKAIGNGKPGPIAKLLRERIVEDIANNGVPVSGLCE